MTHAWEDACDALLSDGTPVRIRPITPDDAGLLVAFHGRLSTETTHLRFFTVHPTLSDAEVARFTTVDHADREALVAITADDIIGVGRWDRVPGTDDAEVAFVVEDRWQGHGVGTLLLEHLTARARRLGLRRFVAETLPHNRRMLGVFADTRLGTQRRLVDRVVQVTIPLEPTPEALAAVEQREHVAEAHSIARVLAPRSVAVVGATDREGTVGRALVRSIVEGGFRGPIHPVHPTASVVAGLPAFRTVTDIPTDVDLAVVAVPAEAVREVVEECGAKGVRGVVVVSAGFAEVGAEGAARQREIVTVARRWGMRLIGPNCVGVANLDPSVALDATFAGVRPAPGPVGLLSQSGAVGIAVLHALSRIGLGLSTFVSVGNKADVSGNDLLQYWDDDPSTEIVLLYLESLGNPRKFSRLARRISRTKPIVVVKSGRTDTGRRAAASHTAALAGSEAATAALFAESGVIRVGTVREMLGAARVLVDQPLPAGPRVAIVGNSGGPGIMAADACDAAGLTPARLGEATVRRLRDALPPAASTANPVDVLASGGAAAYAAAIAAVLDDDGVDSVVVVFTPTLVADVAAFERAVLDALADRARPKPVVVAHLTADDGVLDGGPGRRVPRFDAVDEAIVALGHATARAEWLQREAGAVPVLPDVDPGAARELIDRCLARFPGGTWLDASDASALIAAYGIRPLPMTVVSDVDAAVAAAGEMGFPVALKVASGAVVHKTDVGGVAVDLDSEQAVRRAWESMRDLVVTGGAVVQPMAAAGVETIAGIVQDATFGPLVLFGLGGTAAELIGDRCLRLVPLTDVGAAEMVRSLRTSALLFGHRGAQPVDVDALEGVLLRLAQLAEDHPEVAEVDLNPVIAAPSGVGVVDVKVRLAPVSPAEPAVRRLPAPRPAPT